MDLSAKGLRVLVTAGGAGIGRIIAQTFREHGAKVHTCDVDAATRPDTLCDVSKLDEVERLFEAVAKALGGLDVLINNAGIAGPTARVEDIRPEDWDRTIAIDLSGMFYCTRKAMPMIKRSGGGSIVNLSSAAGRHGFPQRTPYAAAKWGVVGFTKSLAVEAGPDKVRVNAILPGIVEGERIRRVMAAKAEERGIAMEEQLKLALGQASIKALIEPRQLADMIVFLASPLGRTVSGQAISVDGDLQSLAG
jgi:NAD(P)-dependent dehydrogenase (short-subunit alcohol dehydrogenase family)